MIKKTTTAKKAPKGKMALTASAVAAAAAASAAPAPQKRAPVAAAPKKKAVAAAKPAPAKTISPEERFKMIEQAAYFRAEKHGFQVDPQANWIAAEKEVDAILAKGKK